MKRRPEFTIIAGPNGASKSRLGIFYSTVKAFDGDLLAMSLRNEHPDWIERWIDGTVISSLMKEKRRSHFTKQEFCFRNELLYRFASQSCSGF